MIRNVSPPSTTFWVGIIFAMACITTLSAEHGMANNIQRIDEKDLFPNKNQKKVTTDGGVGKKSKKLTMKKKKEESGASEDDEALAMKRRMEATSNCGAYQYKYPSPSVLRCESCQAVVRIVHFLITKLFVDVVDVFNNGGDEEGGVRKNPCYHLASFAELRQYTNGQKFWDISRALVREKDRVAFPGVTKASMFSERVTRGVAQRLLKTPEIRKSNNLHFYVDNDFYTPLPTSGRLEYNMNIWEKNNLGEGDGDEQLEDEENNYRFTQEEKTFALFNREAVPVSSREGEGMQCATYTLKNYCEAFIGAHEDEMEECVTVFNKEEQEESLVATKTGKGNAAATNLYACLLQSCNKHKEDCDASSISKQRQREYNDFIKKMADGGEIGQNMNPYQIQLVGELGNPFSAIKNPFWKEDVRVEEGKEEGAAAKLPAEKAIATPNNNEL